MAALTSDKGLWGGPAVLVVAGHDSDAPGVAAAGLELGALRDLVGAEAGVDQPAVVHNAASDGVGNLQLEG